MRSRRSMVLYLCCTLLLSITTNTAFAYQNTSTVPKTPRDNLRKPNDKDSTDKDDKKPSPRTTTRKTYSRAELLARTRMLTSSRMPNMWGDFFDGTPYPLTLKNPGGLPEEWLNDFTPSTTINPPNPGGSVNTQPPGLRLPRTGGLALRRVKLAENSSPLPMDRWIGNYNLFDNVDGIGDVTRFTLGVEKTFDDGLKSFEARISFAHTLSSNQIYRSPIGAPPFVTQNLDDEFGNLVLTYKQIIRPLDDGIVTAGIGIGLPTADHQLLFNREEVDPVLLMKVHNDAVHLMPFIAFMRQPSDKLVIQGFAQVDFATSGNPVLIRSETGPGPLTNSAKIEAVPLLFLDLGLAYKWIENREGLINAITPLLELHYSLGMRDRDQLQSGQAEPPIFDFESSGRISVLNLTAGVSLQLGDSIFVRPAFSIPLSNGAGASYDYEFGVHVNILR
jgi:hypothetical protein